MITKGKKSKAINISKYFLRLSLLFWLITIFGGCTSKPKEADLFKLKWEKSKQNPVIRPDDSGWDFRQIFPGSVLKQNDRFLIWYYGVGIDGISQIRRRESKDGISWEKSTTRPVLTPGNSSEWDAASVSKPCVWIENDEYEMWYIGEKKDKVNLIPQIGKATSTNGTDWNKSDINPIFDLRIYNLPWASFLRYFWVIREGTTYKMWFSAVGEKSYKNIESIGYAYSEDGIEWKVHPDPVLERDTLHVGEDFYVSNPMVMKRDSIYYMFYGGLGRYGYLFKESIGIAKSIDGIRWEKYSGNPIVYYTEKSQAWDREFVTSPRALMVREGLYYLWYLGADEKNTRDEFGNYHIGLAIGNY